MALISVLSATRVSLHMFSYNVNLSHQDECSNGKNLVKKNVFFHISLALILLFFLRIVDFTIIVNNKNFAFS